MKWLLLLLLAVSMVVIVCIFLFCRKECHFTIWQCLVLPVIYIIFGFFSIKLMFFIENGNFDGESFFGTVFFIPIFLLPIAPLIRVKYLEMLDMLSATGCMALAVCKIRCLVVGCCQGIVIATNGSEEIRFPCQICELITASVLSVFLIILVKREKCKHQVYPIFLVIYGFFRFIWNVFRDEQSFAFGLPIGNLWAFDAFLIGIVWLLIYNFVIKGRQKQAKQAIEADRRDD